MKRTCSECRFWSEMIAEAHGNHVVAMCLSDAGPYKGRLVPATQTCEAWRSGHYGAVDGPPDYGRTAMALYAADETY